QGGHRGPIRGRNRSDLDVLVHAKLPRTSTKLLLVWTRADDPESRIRDVSANERQRVQDSLVALVALEPADGQDQGFVGGILSGRRRCRKVRSVCDEHEPVARNAQSPRKEVRLEPGDANER